MAREEEEEAMDTASVTRLLQGTSNQREGTMLATVLRAVKAQRRRNCTDDTDDQESPGTKEDRSVKSCRCNQFSTIFPRKSVRKSSLIAHEAVVHDSRENGRRMDGPVETRSGV